MKTIKWIFLIALILIACEKGSEKRCWECETLMTYETTGVITQSETLYFDMCDFTEDEIRLFEETRSFVVRVNTGTKIMSNIQETKCK